MQDSPPLALTSVPAEPVSDLLLKRELSEDTVSALLRSYLRTAAPSAARTPSWDDPLGAFFSIQQPDIETSLYVRRLVQYTRCSHSAFILAIIYLERLRSRHPSLAPSALNMHRLLVTAVLIAAKTVDDRVSTNTFFARVGGVPAVQELNALELLMLRLLDYRTFVSADEYAAAVRHIATSGLPSQRCAPKEQEEKQSDSQAPRPAEEAPPVDRAMRANAAFECKAAEEGLPSLAPGQQDICAFATHGVLSAVVS